MHYSEGDLYFYHKKICDLKKMDEISEHLETCLKCRNVLDSIASFSGLCASTMDEAPEFEPAVFYVKRRHVIRFFDRLAVAAIFIVLLCAGVIGKTIFTEIFSRKSAEDFLLNTYNSSSHFKEYSANYLERIKITGN
jgi:hypothetical protein